MGLLKTLGDIAGGVSSVGSIASGVNSIFSLFDSQPSQQDLMDWQEEMMYKQFAFQSQEARKNRDFQAEQADISRDWNSIGSQLGRASEAGVNPYSLVDSGSYGSAAGSPTPSGSMAGSASVPTPPGSTMLQKLQGYNIIADVFSKMAASSQALSTARKQGVETSYLEQTMSDMMESLKQSVEGQKLANALNSIRVKYEDTRQSREVEKLFREINLLISQDVNTKQEYYEIVSRIKSNLAKADLDAASKKQIEIYLDGYAQKIWSSQANANNASAALSREKVNTEKTQQTLNLEKAQTERTQQDLNTVNKKLGDIQLDIKKASSAKEKAYLVENFTQLADQAGLMTSLMKEKLEEAKRNNDWATVEKICNTIHSLSESFNNVAGGVSGIIRAKKP